MTTYNEITPDVFHASVANQLASRFDQLTEGAIAQWGKMNAGQMLKHIADNAEMEFGDAPLGRRFIGRLFGKMVLKKIVKDDDVLDKNNPTHPNFVIKDAVDFESEKARAIQLVERLGEVEGSTFETRVHPFYGKMQAKEWSIWIYKHLDHHLRQFGV